jgi:hypothetical protein
VGASAKPQPETGFVSQVFQRDSKTKNYEDGYREKTLPSKKYFTK